MKKKKLVLVMLACCMFGSTVTCVAADAENLTLGEVWQKSDIEISTNANW